MVHKFTCEKQIRLDLFLRDAIKQLDDFKDDQSLISNSKVRRLIIAGAVAVNDKPIRVPSYVVFRKSTITLALDTEKFFYEKPAHDISFEVSDQDILYEDEVIILVNKPAFFPVEATMVESRDNLHAALVRYLHGKNPALRNPPYVGIMHRLDHETSGVILFTKQRTVNTAVHAMFEEHTAQKIYRAVVQITPRGKSVIQNRVFSVDMDMGRISPKSSAAKWGPLSALKGGVHAHTDFTCIKTGLYHGVEAAILEAKPLTGRTHQIRVHASERGLPLIGDTLYGGCDSDRILLHAQSLTFPHPVTGMMMTVQAPVPDAFLLDQ
ncbi:MAG: RluA family pseudouridine synthase [Treponema sp.]|nr:RluA family pseudouridine synthase [Treponema sp.]